MIMLFIDIIYYDIKYTLQNYEQIDDQLECYSMQLDKLKFTDNNFQQVNDIISNYDYWANLKSTKEKLKQVFHVVRTHK